MNNKKKLQVFVSSTYLDLIEERQAAVQAILSAGHIPAGMELFAAGDESQMTVIERWIDESDAFLLILGGRYGSVEPKSGKSYTHLEYEYAVQHGKAIFAVVIDKNTLEEKVKSEGTSIIENKFPIELNNFRSQVLSNMSVFWKDAKDIQLAVFKTLSNFSNRKNLTGWIKGNERINTGIMAEELARLSEENTRLRNQIKNLNSEESYAGFSFNELVNILKSKIVDSLDAAPDGEDLYQFFMRYADNLALGLKIGDADHPEAFDLLVVYRLAIKTKLKGGYKSSKDDFSKKYNYTITDDAHKFYLKCLTTEIKSEEN